MLIYLFILYIFLYTYYVYIYFLYLFIFDQKLEHGQSRAFFIQAALLDSAAKIFFFVKKHRFLPHNITNFWVYYQKKINYSVKVGVIAR